MVTNSNMMMGVPGGGDSAIFRPNGRQPSIDIPETEEGTMYAELDSHEILKERGFLTYADITAALTCVGWELTTDRSCT